MISPPTWSMAYDVALAVITDFIPASPCRRRLLFAMEVKHGKLLGSSLGGIHKGFHILL